MTNEQERQALVTYFVDKLGGVMAGAHPDEKRPRTSRPDDAGSAPWDVHQREGHLDRGVAAYIKGEIEDAYLVPGSIRTRGAWLACADVDDVSAVDWADRATEALGFACTPVLTFAKPDGSGKRHVWVLAAESVGNGNLFVEGRKVGEWRGRWGGTVGVGMRLYEGEGQALMEALQTGVKKGFGAAGGSSKKKPEMKRDERARDLLEELHVERGILEARREREVRAAREAADWLAKREELEERKRKEKRKRARRRSRIRWIWGVAVGSVLVLLGYFLVDGLLR